MDWSASTWWWIAAGALVAGELATGTFYVLMLAIGCVVGALAGYAGISFFAQVVAAVVVGGAAVLAWHRKRMNDPRVTVNPAANRDLNLDIGEQVHVDGWNADGTARVPYRGSAWNVRYVGDGPAAPGLHVIAEVRHNELALRRAA